MNDGVGYMYAPMLIGTLLNCILYGATLMQVVVYFQTFKSDKWWMKMFVFYLLFCETLNTVFDAGVIYEPLIIRYGNQEVLSTQAPKMISTNPLMTVIVSLPVQLFIAWRVKVMTRSSILPAIITFFAIAAFVGGIATSVAVTLINFEYARFAQNEGAVITWLAASATADIIITTSLVSSLLHKRTGFGPTDDIINRVIRLTVQTGLITAVTATMDITFFLVYKDKTWNFIWDLMLSKLYSNTILSSLNSRCGWKASSTVAGNVLFGDGTGAESVARSRMGIEVVTMTTVTTDFHPQPHSARALTKVPGSGAASGQESDSSSGANVVQVFGEAS